VMIAFGFTHEMGYITSKLYGFYFILNDSHCVDCVEPLISAPVVSPQTSGFLERGEIALRMRRHTYKLKSWCGAGVENGGYY
jgi:hypothetical protein